MSAELTLADRCAFMDRLSHEMTEPTRVLPVEEGVRLAQVHGVPANASAIERACAGVPSPASMSGDWDRPKSCADLNDRRARLQAKVTAVRHRQKHQINPWFIFGMSLFTVAAALMMESKHHVNVMLFLTAMAGGWTVMLLISTIKSAKLEYELAAAQRAMKDANLEPGLPTRHELQNWRRHPRLMAHLKQCLASEVGLLKGDIAQLNRASEVGLPEERVPVDAVALWAEMNALEPSLVLKEGEASHVR